MQIQLTPFLESNAGQFMLDLWKLLLSAMKHPSGIPQEFIDAKAEEEKKKRMHEEEMDRRYQDRRAEAYREEHRSGREPRDYAERGRRPRSPRRRSRSYSPDRRRHSPRPRRDSYSPQRSVRRGRSPGGYRRNHNRDQDRDRNRSYRRRSPSYERYNVSQRGSRADGDYY